MKIIQLTKNPYFGNLMPLQIQFNNISIHFQRTFGTNEIVRG